MCVSIARGHTTGRVQSGHDPEPCEGRGRGREREEKRTRCCSLDGKGIKKRVTKIAELEGGASRGRVTQPLGWGVQDRGWGKEE